MEYNPTRENDALAQLPEAVREIAEKFLSPPPIVLTGQQPDPPLDPIDAGGSIWSDKRLFLCTADGKSIQTGIDADGKITRANDKNKGDLVWVDDTAPTDMLDARNRSSNYSYIIPVPSWHTPEKLVELIKQIAPDITGPLEIDDRELASPDDVRFRQTPKEDRHGIQRTISTHPRGYCISLDSTGTRVALSFHPNLLDGDSYPRGPWNLSDRHIAEGGAFALITWESTEDCPVEKLREEVYKHWRQCQKSPDIKKEFWAQVSPSSEATSGGGW